jgi:hypothetical protein
MEKRSLFLRTGAQSRNLASWRELLLVCVERWKGSTPSSQPPFSSGCLRVRCGPFRRDGRADSIPGRRGRAKPLLGWVPRLSAISSAIPYEESHLLRHGGESVPRRRFEHRRGRRSDCYTRPELRGGGVPGSGPRACSAQGFCMALRDRRHNKSASRRIVGNDAARHFTTVERVDSEAIVVARFACVGLPASCTRRSDLGTMGWPSVL